MGRKGKSGMSSGGGAGTQEPRRSLISKSQVDELTQDFTPSMFLGDNFESTFINSPNSLKEAADNNMPDTLDIGGYTFRSMGDATVSYEKNKNIAMLDYQCTEQIGDEFPVLQVGISAWRTRGGGVKTEIIRDGYTNKTRFW